MLSKFLRDLNNELENLQDYIDRRPEFYSYYRLGSTENDAYYFTRDKFVLGFQYLEPTLSERLTSEGSDSPRQGSMKKRWIFCVANN